MWKVLIYGGKSKKFIRKKHNILGGQTCVGLSHHLGGVTVLPSFYSQMDFSFLPYVYSLYRNLGALKHYSSRSTDYGTSFQREDKTKFNKGSKNINGIHFCKGNNKRVRIKCRHLYFNKIVYFLNKRENQETQLT